MLDALDRRVVPEALIALVRDLQAQEPVHLAGGLALSGAHLAHRLSDDVDLFAHDAETHRRAIGHLRRLVEEPGGQLTVVHDGGPYWRAHVRLSGGLEHHIDLVHEMVPDLAPPEGPIDGIVVESLQDLRASKLTCLLSRSEPRDLVDVLFLEQRGFRPEDDLALAVRKDTGVDPGTLAWLLSAFPVEPLPRLLEPLTVVELRAYRDELAARMKRLATAG